MTPKTDETTPRADDAPPPFGSWPRTYALVCFTAVVVVLSLWWLTHALDLGSVK